MIFSQVPREELKSHLQSAIVSHVDLVQEDLTKKLKCLEEREINLESRNEERYGELQIEMNAVKGQLEKEVQGIQTLKEELQTLQAAAEAKDNTYAQQINNLEEEVNTIRNEKGQLMTELQNLQAASQAKDNHLKHFKEEINNLSRLREEKINTLQNEQNAYVQQINNLENRIFEELNRANWNTNVKIAVVGTVVGIIFAVIKVCKLI